MKTKHPVNIMVFGVMVTLSFHLPSLAQLAGAVEYTNFVSAEG